MSEQEPVTELSAYSSDGAIPTGLVADTYESKYGAPLTAPQGTWFGLADAIRGHSALVYRVTPTTAFGFGKGKQFSQTRWRFSRQAH